MSNYDGRPGSGCVNCPVENCQTMSYRSSTCAGQRDKLGLGDPMTWVDKIRGESDEYLARQFAIFFLGGMQSICSVMEVDMPLLDDATFEKLVNKQLEQLYEPYDLKNDQLPYEHLNPKSESEQKTKLRFSARLCEVGQTVYWCGDRFRGIQQVRIIGIHIGAYGYDCYECIGIEPDSHTPVELLAADFGVTWFTDIEKANARCEELRKQKGPEMSPAAHAKKGECK